MNRIDKFFGRSNEARVRYSDGEFQVLSAGEYVRCAVTGRPIALTDLKYWNVARQEAYASAEISFQRYIDLRERARSRSSR